MLRFALMSVVTASSDWEASDEGLSLLQLRAKPATEVEQPIEYVIANKQNTCPDGSSPIADAAACKAAAPNLEWPGQSNGKWKGGTVGGPEVTGGNWPFMPPGCVLYTAWGAGSQFDAWVRWNDDANGKNDGNRGIVCQTGGDESEAVGDPHITTNAGKHLDLSLLQPATEDVKGNDLIARVTPDNAVNIEFVDRGAGPFSDAGILSSVRFYVQREGDKGLRFRIYRPAGGGFTLVGQTEAIAMQQAGAIQEVTFSEPVEYEAGDYIGWCHDADGNIPFGIGGGRVSWEYNKNSNLGASRGFGAGGARTYSYQVTTSPKTTTTTPPPAPEPPADDAEAVGDPHIKTNSGVHFDLQ